MMSSKLADIQAIQAMSAVPTIMKMVAEMTGQRFICVARVTPGSWTACAVQDDLAFNLQPGDELDIDATICNEVCTVKQPVFINHVSEDSDYCDHRVPKKYGFESYFSIPIYRPEGEIFGTLCGLDPLPANLEDEKIKSTLSSFADLISRQLEAETRAESAEMALRDERSTAELREQFIAVLGHDLRTPLSSIMMGAELLKRLPQDPKGMPVLDRIHNSVNRISNLVDNVLDFAYGRMGEGIPLRPTETTALGQTLQHVVTELRSTHKGHTINADINITDAVQCDPERIGQLLSNLLINALVHGDAQKPVRVTAGSEGKTLFIEVCNAGSPIPQETMERLFQPFWRSGDRNASKGLGLGLFIASEIAKAHQGALEVKSSEEQTSFRFSAALVFEAGANPTNQVQQLAE